MVCGRNHQEDVFFLREYTLSVLLVNHQLVPRVSELVHFPSQHFLQFVLLLDLLFALFDLVNQLFPAVNFAISAPEYFVLALHLVRCFLDLVGYFVDGIATVF